MKFKHAWLLVAVLLAACATFGIETPKTFNERAAFAHETVNGAIRTATNSLNAGAITSAEAEAARANAVSTRTFIAAAEAAYGSGDISTAEGKLAFAENILRQLQGYVEVKK